MREQVGNQVGYRTRLEAFKAADQMKIPKDELIMIYDAGSYYLMIDKEVCTASAV